MAIDLTQTISREDCVAADTTDPLAPFRDRFLIPEGVIYLDGNSLGVRPKGAQERAEEVVKQEWGEDLVTSWNKNGWFDLPKRLGDKINQLVGGGEGGCVVTDSTSVNLYKVLSAAVQIQKEDAPERKVIISERDNFPTDLYIIEGLIGQLDDGYELRLIDEENPLEDLLDDNVAVVLLAGVNYRTGAMWDMKEVTKQIHDAGALAVWDLSHSSGAVPVNLSAAEADFAAGCTYKYLNGGPGAPAFLWVNDKHIARAQHPLSGWWGHADPFQMADSYDAAAGIDKFLTGTQPIVSMSAMEPGLDIALEVDEGQLREKSLALTNLFMALVDQRLGDHPLTLITPVDESKRGSHVSYRHPEGYAVMQALIDQGVIGDYREPEVLRLGVTPLYLGYADIWDAVETLREVLDDELWKDPKFQVRGAVT